jgi:hypothetical protein
MRRRRSGSSVKRDMEGFAPVMSEGRGVPSRHEHFDAVRSYQGTVTRRSDRRGAGPQPRGGQAAGVGAMQSVDPNSPFILTRGRPPKLDKPRQCDARGHRAGRVIRRPPRPLKANETMLEYVTRTGGGLNDVGGDLEGDGRRRVPPRAPFRRKLIDNENGQSLDEAFQRAIDAGYFPEHLAGADQLRRPARPRPSWRRSTRSCAGGRAMRSARRSTPPRRRAAARIRKRLPRKRRKASQIDPAPHAGKRVGAQFRADPRRGRRAAASTSTTSSLLDASDLIDGLAWIPTTRSTMRCWKALTATSIARRSRQVTVIMLSVTTKGSAMAASPKKEAVTAAISRLTLAVDDPKISPALRTRLERDLHNLRTIQREGSSTAP